MTTYVGGPLDHEHIAERTTAEYLERLARQAMRELSISAVCTALDISEDRRKELLADYDWPLLRGLRICFLLGALDPRAFERAIDEATDPDLMIQHLPTIPPDIPYTPPPTHTLPGGTPYTPPPPFAPTTPPPPLVLSVPTPITLYRTDADGLLSHIIGYAMTDIEEVAITAPDLPEPALMMDGTVLAPPVRPTHAYVELTVHRGISTMSHPYPNEDVGRLVLLLKEFRARRGYGPTLHASS